MTSRRSRACLTGNSMDNMDLRDGLTQQQLALRPMCRKCGWAMGGVDSWNGVACRCGFRSAPYSVLLAPPGK